MRDSKGPTWVVFALCSMLVSAALVGMGTVVLRLERSELTARAEAQYQESLRLSLWRMDSWLSVFLARESARSHDDYVVDAKTNSLRIDPTRADFLTHYFQVFPDGESASTAITRGPVPDALVEHVTFEIQQLRPALEQAELRLASMLDLSRRVGSSPEIEQSPQILRSRAEFDARQACSVPRAPGEIRAGEFVTDIGPLVPLWLDDADHSPSTGLVCVRRLRLGEQEVFQGFVLNWPNLRSTLLSEVHDLLPGAVLERTTAISNQSRAVGRTLANIPAVVTSAREATTIPMVTPTRTVLALTWLASIAAIMTVGITLHQSLELAERRRRFVATVTHEMRTPLTTFQMYSEMLAKGFVKNEEQRQLYLDTLHTESARLSAMVENVLEHARLESGSAPTKERLLFTELVDRLVPALEGSARSHDIQIRFETHPCEEPVNVDVGATRRILTNLIDNAGKYGGSDPAVTFEARMTDEWLVFTVRDRGPGIPDSHRKNIFLAFERGSHSPADGIPGVGLGLAVARGLARQLGGELSLSHPPQGGCAFTLCLPVH